MELFKILGCLSPPPCLAVFVWLLTLHPHAAGRVYAAYGGVYIGVALTWLWVVDSLERCRWRRRDSPGREHHFAGCQDMNMSEGPQGGKDNRRRQSNFGDWHGVRLL